MSDATHTPGPWKYRQAPDHAGYEIDAEGWFSFARVERFDDFDHTDTEETREHDAECLGNACLIAAAPELLEALEEIERVDVKLPFGLLGQVRAAIEKAKGA